MSNKNILIIFSIIRYTYHRDVHHFIFIIIIIVILQMFSLLSNFTSSLHNGCGGEEQSLSEPLHEEVDGHRGLARLLQQHVLLRAVAAARQILVHLWARLLRVRMLDGLAEAPDGQLFHGLT